MAPSYPLYEFNLKPSAQKKHKVFIYFIHDLTLALLYAQSAKSLSNSKVPKMEEK